MKHLSSFLKSVTFLFASLIIFLSLISYSSFDLPVLTSPAPAKIHNLIGIAGAYLAFVLFFIAGYSAYFIPFYLFFMGMAYLGRVRFYGLAKSRVINTISFLLFIIFLSSLIGIFCADKKDLFKSAGLIGFILSDFFKKYLGVYGSVITFSFILVINAALLFGFLFIDLFSYMKELAPNFAALFKKLKGRKKYQPLKKEFVFFKEDEPRQKALRKEDKPSIKEEPRPALKPEIKLYAPKVEAPRKDISSKPVTPLKPENGDAAKKKIEKLESQVTKKFDPQTYKLPDLASLKIPPHLDYREVKEDIEASIKNLEDTLFDFGVEAKVVSVQKGPVVTMYELAPEAGVKIQKITALADDIALAMKSSSVRVVAPIPGRGTVGVEVPNEKKHVVFLREVLEEKAFIESPSKLTLAIGKDVSGNPVIADLKEMPHLLIAGATGAGKTVCVNSIISSIIFKAKPDEVKFVLIDPKMVELAVFAGIPHLLHPIIFEAKKAFTALNWAVTEMERRYRVLAEEGVRNIDAYNKNDKKLHYIIIIIDELADLMVVARENIETAIQRLAQLSRAVGIHLILATQRPSVDVVTGVIKANFPARISFKVASKVDSRTVLDSMGADKLLGKGDLLFIKPGATKMIRAQGCFIDDEDIENLTNFIREQGGPSYEEGILEAEKRGVIDVEADELLDEAIKTVLQSRQASASILQRRMRVGYTRAARLLDLMEQRGIVGPFCGSKAREILVDPQAYLEENYSGTAQQDIVN